MKWLARAQGWVAVWITVGALLWAAPAFGQNPMQILRLRAGASKLIEALGGSAHVSCTIPSLLATELSTALRAHPSLLRDPDVHAFLTEARGKDQIGRAHV